MNRQAIAILLLALNGCQALMTSPAGPPSVSRIEIDRRPDGDPHVQVTASPTGDQWTIQVTQPFTHTEEIQTSTPHKARRYLFWPLAPLNGILQCPIGLLVNALSSHEAAVILREIGCMRLIAMEPLGKTIQTRTVVERRQERRRSESPVVGAEVVFHSTTNEVIRRVTGTDGSASLQGLTTGEIAGTLRVSVGNRLVFHRDLVLAQSVKTGRREHIDLPRSAVIQIESYESSSNAPHTLRKLLLERGFMVLPAKEAQAAILDEQKFQMMGRTEDSTRVRSGRMMRPTVIIHVSKEQEGPYLLNVSSVEKGEEQDVVIDELSSFAKLLN